MTEFADKLISDVRERARVAFDELGEQALSALREAVSVPVQRSGSRVIRSSPGEPPREETSEYINSLARETQDTGTSVSAIVFTDLPRGAWLERGTSRMAARPHFAPIYDRYAALAAEAIGRRMFQT